MRGNRKKHNSKHHVCPTSRRGERCPKNELDLDPNLHWAWHILFGNLMIEEVIGLIKYVWQDGSGVIQEKFIRGEIRENKVLNKIIGGKRIKRDIRASAWKIIFGDTRSVKKTVKIIRHNFEKGT